MDYYLLKLTNTEINAKISLNNINQITIYKWYLGKNGYPFAYINNKRIPLHRYVHWLNNKYWSSLYIDHINRDKLDATDTNLREATAAENSYNKTFKNPNHNIKHNKTTNTFIVCIVKNKQKYHIDNIKTLEEAKSIYKLMSEELYGNFAAI